MGCVTFNIFPGFHDRSGSSSGERIQFGKLISVASTFEEHLKIPIHIQEISTKMNLSQIKLCKSNNSTIVKGFLGKIKENGFPIAIKQISKKKLGSLDLNLVQREIDILSLLDHPHVIRYFRTYYDNDNYYIILEEGKKDLYEWLISKNEMIQENDAKKIIYNMLKVLNYLHIFKICHGDIKPDNILLFGRDSSFIKLIDFGISSQKYSYCPHSIGTRAYLPPEFYEDPSQISIKLDVWSLGVTLFQIINGYLPFGENSDNNRLEFRICNDKLTIDNQKISPLCQDIIYKMLEKNCEKRPSVSELLNHPWFNDIKISPTKQLNYDNVIQKLIEFQSLDPIIKLFHTLLARFIPFEEVEKITEDFETLDTLFNGVVSDEELKIKFPTLTKEEIKNCAGLKNFITYSEFIAALYDKEKLLHPQRINFLFELLHTTPDERKAIPDSNEEDKKLIRIKDKEGRTYLINKNEKFSFKTLTKLLH